MHPFRSSFILILSFCLQMAAQSDHPALQERLPSAPSASADSAFAAPRRLLQQGKNEEAITQLQQMEAVNPAMKGLAHELGVAYYKSGDYVKAIDAFRKATNEDSQDNEAIQLLGLSDYLAGRPADAIPLLEKVQGWYPRANIDASYILGICYIQTKDYPQARKAFARMFDVPSDSAAAYLFTARVLLRQEFDPIAEEHAQKAIALDPTFSEAHFQLGNLLSDQTHYAEAIPQYLIALDRDSKIPDAHYRLGQAYVHTGQKDKAQAQLALYQQQRAQHLADLDKQRAEIRQFVYSEENRPAKQ